MSALGRLGTQISTVESKSIFSIAYTVSIMVIMFMDSFCKRYDFGENPTIFHKMNHLVYQNVGTFNQSRHFLNGKLDRTCISPYYVHSKISTIFLFYFFICLLIFYLFKQNSLNFGREIDY